MLSNCRPIRFYYSSILESLHLSLNEIQCRIGKRIVPLRWTTASRDKNVFATLKAIPSRITVMLRLIRCIIAVYWSALRVQRAKDAHVTSAINIRLDGLFPLSSEARRPSRIVPCVIAAFISSLELSFRQRNFIDDRTNVPRAKKKEKRDLNRLIIEQIANHNVKWRNVVPAAD